MLEICITKDCAVFSFEPLMVANSLSTFTDAYWSIVTLLTIFLFNFGKCRQTAKSSPYYVDDMCCVGLCILTIAYGLLVLAEHLYSPETVERIIAKISRLNDAINILICYYF